MKPQDVVILSSLLVRADPRENLAHLGKRSGLSASETCESLKRLGESALIDRTQRAPYKAAALEFFIHGLRYVFPARLGGRVRGMSTAHSAEPLVKLFGNAGESRVWPYERGREKGEALLPLYPSVPSACEHQPELHGWLALLDAVRGGAARERKAAIQILQDRLGANV